MDFLSSIRSKVNNFFGGEGEEAAPSGEKEYVELDTSSKERRGKVVVRPFIINDFADIKEILEVLREGSTIVLINIKPLKDKDLIELKRAINKLKKTTDAIEGDIAGFGDDYVIVTPSFAKVYRTKAAPAAAGAPQEAQNNDEYVEIKAGREETF
ncbi:MAG: cell division protein SepF [Candidatus Woesearchaeota archaeon]